MKLNRRDAERQSKNGTRVTRTSDVLLSLAPGFSRVTTVREDEKPFQRFRHASGKPLKRLKSFASANTRLKTGANEIGQNRALNNPHALVPLTLALSLGEREQQSALAGVSMVGCTSAAFWLFAGKRHGKPKRKILLENRRMFLPLPEGEGRGEGKGTVHCSKASHTHMEQRTAIF